MRQPLWHVFVWLTAIPTAIACAIALSFGSAAGDAAGHTASVSSKPVSSSSNGGLIARGEYIAKAADCAGSAGPGCVAIGSAGRASSDMKRTAYITTE
jgi:hypothetical protein